MNPGVSEIPVISGEAVLGAISPATAVERTRHAFERYAAGEWEMPAKVYLDSPPHGDFRAMPARGDGLALHRAGGVEQQHTGATRLGVLGELNRLFEFEVLGHRPGGRGGRTAAQPRDAGQLVAGCPGEGKRWNRRGQGAKTLPSAG